MHATSLKPYYVPMSRRCVDSRVAIHIEHRFGDLGSVSSDTSGVMLNLSQRHVLRLCLLTRCCPTVLCVAAVYRNTQKWWSSFGKWSNKGWLSAKEFKTSKHHEFASTLRRLILKISGKIFEKGYSKRLQTVKITMANSSFLNKKRLDSNYQERM